MKHWIIRCDYERYGSIAERYPATLLVNGTKEQAEKLTNELGWIEAGCNDLFYFEDESIDINS